MSHFIDWQAVIYQFTPTKLAIGVGFYVMVRSIIRVLRFIYAAFSGFVLSNERRAIVYLHHRQGHAGNVATCVIRDCDRKVAG